jgi:hypothetical protein
MTEPATLHPALVVIVNNARDWERVSVERWYRLPLRRAPAPTAALFLAFYLTRAVGVAPWQVAWLAPVERYRVVTRRELLPDEAGHPRAAERYYKIELGALEALPRPIPSRRLRRITFIPTTLERLHSARDVAELWHTDEAAAILWQHFPDAVRKATSRLALEERRAVYRYTRGCL